jgi:hypothetical protein
MINRMDGKLWIRNRIKAINGDILGYTVNSGGSDFELSKEKTIELASKNMFMNAMLTSTYVIRGTRGTIPSIIKKKVNVPKQRGVYGFDTKCSKGELSKGWYNINDNVILVKGNYHRGSMVAYEPYSEVIASRLLCEIGLNTVPYALSNKNLYYDVEVYKINHVSLSKKFLEENERSMSFRSYAKMLGFELNGTGRENFDVIFKVNLDPVQIMDMLIADALIGNIDRSFDNWDVIIGESGTKYAPIFDLGASLLAFESDEVLRNTILMQADEIGDDRSRPFKKRHSSQLMLVEDAIRKHNLVTRFMVVSDDLVKIVDSVLTRSVDVFIKMPEIRVRAIKRYLRNRSKYIQLRMKSLRRSLNVVGW